MRLTQANQLPAVSLIVRDLETGDEHCFKVDLSSGETATCG